MRQFGWWRVLCGLGLAAFVWSSDRHLGSTCSDASSSVDSVPVDEEVFGDADVFFRLGDDNPESLPRIFDKKGMPYVPTGRWRSLPSYFGFGQKAEVCFSDGAEISVGTEESIEGRESVGKVDISLWNLKQQLTFVGGPKDKGKEFLVFSPKSDAIFWANAIINKTKGSAVVVRVSHLLFPDDGGDESLFGKLEKEQPRHLAKLTRALAAELLNSDQRPDLFIFIGSNNVMSVPSVLLLKEKKQGVTLGSLDEGEEDPIIDEKKLIVEYEEFWLRHFPAFIGWPDNPKKTTMFRNTQDCGLFIRALTAIACKEERGLWRQLYARSSYLKGSLKSATFSSASAGFYALPGRSRGEIELCLDRMDRFIGIVEQLQEQIERKETQKKIERHNEP